LTTPATAKNEQTNRAKLDEIQHSLETAGEQHQAGDRELEEDGIGRRATGRFAGEYL